MSKINKYANIYDKEGNLLRHVDEDGVLKPYTIQELEDLVDKLGEDKDENGKVKDPDALNNAMAELFKMYQLYGNPHATELLNKLNNQSTKEQAQEALKETAEELEKTAEQSRKEAGYEEAGDLDYYVPFEEVK